MARKRLHALKGTLIFSSLVITLIGGVGYASYDYQQSKLLLRNQAQENLKSVLEQLQQERQEQQLIGTYAPLFQGYKENGLIGDAQRLSWVEALQKAAQTTRVLLLRYDFNPQEPYVAGFLPAASGFQVYVTPMKLRIEAVHEGDVLDILASLDTASLKTMTVRSCIFERSEPLLRMSGRDANVVAMCDLRWPIIRIDTATPEQNAI